MAPVTATQATRGLGASTYARVDPTDWRVPDGRDDVELLRNALDILAMCVRDNMRWTQEDASDTDDRTKLAVDLVEAFKAHGRPSASFVIPNRSIAAKFGKTDDAWDKLTRAYREFAADHAYRCRQWRAPRVFFTRYPGFPRGRRAAFQLLVCRSERMGTAATVPDFFHAHPIMYAEEVAEELVAASPPPTANDRESEPGPLHAASSGDGLATAASPEVTALPAPHADPTAESVGQGPKPLGRATLARIEAFIDGHPSIHGLVLIALVVWITYLFGELSDEPAMKLGGPLVALAALLNAFFRRD